MIIRVFPERTPFTPTDDYAFVGDPPMIRPEADEVHVSCTFTWHKAKSERLQMAWAQYYPVVKLGGPALNDRANSFTSGMYVKQGVTFTSRGCNNQCPWCLVPAFEGKIRELDIQSGYIVQDNNLLQCSKSHISRVFRMLQAQKRGAVFSGGFESSLVNDWLAEQLKWLSIDHVFLAADNEGSLRPLERAIAKLDFLTRDKLRCYVLIALNGESVEKAEDRLRRVWEVGCLPFAQLYQPPTDKKIEYSREWKQFARIWSRPAATKAHMKEASNDRHVWS